MKSPNPKQLKSLEQVLVLQQQNLDLIQAKLQKQRAVIGSLQAKVQQLRIELDESQQASTSESPTASSLQVAMHCMNLIQSKINQNENEIAEATPLLETLRTELREQVSKKEALENFIALQSKKLADDKRTNEQHIADEQYLSRLFTG